MSFLLKNIITINISKYFSENPPQFEKWSKIGLKESLKKHEDQLEKE